MWQLHCAYYFFRFSTSLTDAVVCVPPGVARATAVLSWSGFIENETSIAEYQYMYPVASYRDAYATASAAVEVARAANSTAAAAAVVAAVATATATAAGIAAVAEAATAAVATAATATVAAANATVNTTADAIANATATATANKAAAASSAAASSAGVAAAVAAAAVANASAAADAAIHAGVAAAAAVIAAHSASSTSAPAVADSNTTSDSALSSVWLSFDPQSAAGVGHVWRSAGLQRVVRIDTEKLLPAPSSYAAYVRACNIFNACSVPVLVAHPMSMVDSPPGVGVVNLLNESSSIVVTASWSFPDASPGLTYAVCVGSSPLSCQTRPFETVPQGVTTWSSSGLGLACSMSYFLTVRATNWSALPNLTP